MKINYVTTKNVLIGSAITGGLLLAAGSALAFGWWKPRPIITRPTATSSPTASPTATRTPSATPTATKTPTALPTATATPIPEARTTFGAMTNIVDLDGRNGFLSLTAHALRPVNAIQLDSPVYQCGECVVADGLGIPVLLTIRVSSPQSYTVYVTEVAALLTTIPKPALLVAGNEADSTQWNGTATEYGEFLHAVCDVAHENGLPCADSGYTWKMSACLAEAPNITWTCEQTRMDRAMEMLGYTASYADYVNFHYYEAGADQWKAIVDYLESTTGLPAISNEVGTRTGEAKQVVDVLQVADGIKYLIWYTPLNAGGAYKPFINDDGTLTDAGAAYAAQLKIYYGSP